jgi:hypothetical protein
MKEGNCFVDKNGHCRIKIDFNYCVYANLDTAHLVSASTFNIQSDELIMTTRGVVRCTGVFARRVGIGVDSIKAQVSGPHAKVPGSESIKSGVIGIHKLSKINNGPPSRPLTGQVSQQGTAAPSVTNQSASALPGKMTIKEVNQLHQPIRNAMQRSLIFRKTPEPVASALVNQELIPSQLLNKLSDNERVGSSYQNLRRVICPSNNLRR